MRIAISGSHSVGKTTLAEALSGSLTGYEWIPEPYVLLEEDGHVFAEMPTIEDFEAQLERSLECIHDAGPNVIFDRCPLDLLGYLTTHRDADAFRLEDRMPRIQDSLAMLDTVFFIPIEEPDRIVPSHSEARLRADVDATLTDIIVDDAYGFGVDVEVSGTLAERIQQVLKHLD